MAKSFSLNLDDDALELLIDLIGNDFFKLNNELKKLSLIFREDTNLLSAKSISPELGMLRQDHAFTLTDHILSHKKEAALKLIDQLLTRGESSISILGIIARHCRNSLAFKRQQVLGEPVEVRLPFHVKRTYQSYCQNLDERRISEALSFCQKVDSSLKSSGMSEFILLSSVIDKLPSH